MSSLAASLASLPEADRAAVLAGFSPEQAQELLYDWRFWGRPSQQPPPGDWQFWLIMAGRGFGKTRTGAEWIRMRGEHTDYCDYYRSEEPCNCGLADLLAKVEAKK